MATLTKYDSFEALKANTGSGAENLAESNERHRAFEKFINLLQAQVSRKLKDNTGKGNKEELRNFKENVGR